jgi:hydrogenase expression/formation protein HypD
MQALGGNVQAVYSPLDAIMLATQQPEKQFVFFAVGFETTLPATAIAVLQASESGLKNLSFLLAHVRVSPAMQFVLEQPECSIDGFLAAGHVCTIMGIEECVKISTDYQVPIVVTGFEPLDLLLGIEECVRLLEAKENVVSNLYRRVVNDVGNPSAKRLIAEVFEVDDQDWRGLGHIHQGGFRLTQTYAEWDAANLLVNHGGEGSGWLGRDGSFRQSDECLSGQVLTGKIKPTDCPHFGKRCNPESPLGAPMVSSEGACAAYYQYAQEKVRFSGVDHEGKEYEPT